MSQNQENPELSPPLSADELCHIVRAALVDVRTCDCPERAGRHVAHPAPNFSTAINAALDALHELAASPAAWTGPTVRAMADVAADEWLRAEASG